MFAGRAGLPPRIIIPSIAYRYAGIAIAEPNNIGKNIIQHRFINLSYLTLGNVALNHI